MLSPISIYKILTQN